MKTKKFNKTLALNKKTVAHLNNDNMNALNGGTGNWTEYNTCQTCLTPPGGSFCIACYQEP